MPIQEYLSELIQAQPSGPFLFLGSGFSRRYLGLENWRGLLERYCVAGQPFEFYLASANGSYPAAATLIAEDFNRHWWSSDEYSAQRSRHKSLVRDQTSALRIEIANYLSRLGQATAKSSTYVDELLLLSSLNVDGVITTNWDRLAEEIFPDYKIYVGQDQLLFSNPQEIGEIYKIHGCSSDPSSLVLTKSDYDAFQAKNAYLAAKLITLFVEHPIVFIGYSLSDENILSLLRSISMCIGKERIEQLRRNLIFVQTLSPDEKEGVSDTYLSIDGIQVPLVLVKTDNFIPIYSALNTRKRKIPARILRHCKEQLYELVKSSEPEQKLCVVDYDDIDKKEGVEFLVGVGVAHGDGLIGDVGYEAIDSLALINDILHDDAHYDPGQIVQHVLKNAGRNTKNIPVFKYLSAIGINDAASYEAADLKLDKWVKRNLREFRVALYAKPYFRTFRHKSLLEIVQESTPENAAAYIPYVPIDKIDLGVLREFLIQNQDKLDSNKSSYASNFRKAAVIYDKIRWGW